MVRRRGAREQELQEKQEAGAWKLPPLRPVYIILVLLSLVVVMAVIVGSRPREDNKVPGWLAMIQEAERRAKEAGVQEKEEFQEMEEFVDLWSKRGSVMDGDEDEDTVTE